ncbi:MAG: hypothetical protein V1834_03540 [Candidatus Micrarchaeota archaeon]
MVTRFRQFKEPVKALFPEADQVDVESRMLAHEDNVARAFDHARDGNWNGYEAELKTGLADLSDLRRFFSTRKTKLQFSGREFKENPLVEILDHKDSEIQAKIGQLEFMLWLKRRVVKAPPKKKLSKPEFRYGKPDVPKQKLTLLFKPKEVIPEKPGHEHVSDFLADINRIPLARFSAGLSKPERKKLQSHLVKASAVVSEELSKLFKDAHKEKPIQLVDLPRLPGLLETQISREAHEGRDPDLDRAEIQEREEALTREFSEKYRDYLLAVRREITAFDQQLTRFVELKRLQG